MNKLYRILIQSFSLTIVLSLTSGVFANPPVDSVIVTVPATANGNFGYYPAPCNTCSPLVRTLTVRKAGTLTINYIKGETCGFSNVPVYVADNCFSGPNGFTLTNYVSGTQTPLMEASGVFGAETTNVMALMGAFVPQPLVERTDFSATDQAKLTNSVGITSSMLFFAGNYTVVNVSGPGTLYLGINDSWVDDNSGSLTVQVTSP